MTDSSLQHVVIYTDGACSPNPGTGGWGAVLISQKHQQRKELSGAEAETTNNRLELTAAGEALSALKQPCRVELYTDSSYLRNAFEQKWLQNWQLKNWRTSGGKAVLNRDLWEKLLRLDQLHKIREAHLQYLGTRVGSWPVASQSQDADQEEHTDRRLRGCAHRKTA